VDAQPGRQITSDIAIETGQQAAGDEFARSRIFLPLGGPKAGSGCVKPFRPSFPRRLCNRGSSRGRIGSQRIDFGPDATDTSAQDPKCVADDIEAKWEKAGYPGRL
jgi:hypothetical protein